MSGKVALGILAGVAAGLLAVALRSTGEQDDESTGGMQSLEAVRQQYREMIADLGQRLERLKERAVDDRFIV